MTKQHRALRPGIIGIFLAIGAAWACGETRGAHSGNTNWLKPCQADDECGGLSCVCEYCQKTCAGVLDCSREPADMCQEVPALGDGAAGGGMNDSDAPSTGGAPSILTEDFTPDPGPNLTLNHIVPQRPEEMNWTAIDVQECRGPGEGNCKATVYDVIESCSAVKCGTMVVHIENGCFVEVDADEGLLECAVERLKDAVPCALSGYARAYVSCTVR